MLQCAAVYCNVLKSSVLQCVAPPSPNVTSDLVRGCVGGHQLWYLGNDVLTSVGAWMYLTIGNSCTRMPTHEVASGHIHVYIYIYICVYVCSIMH